MLDNAENDFFVVGVKLMVLFCFRFYHSGVFTARDCKSDVVNVNHAVLVVGYGTDAISGMDYWTVKNSWGASWGVDGYFKIQRGVNLCGVGDCPSYPGMWPPVKSDRDQVHNTAFRESTNTQPSGGLSSSREILQEEQQRGQKNQQAHAPEEEKSQQLDQLEQEKQLKREELILEYQVEQKKTEYRKRVELYQAQRSAMQALKKDNGQEVNTGFIEDTNNNGYWNRLVDLTHTSGDRGENTHVHRDDDAVTEAYEESQTRVVPNAFLPVDL
eukprot:GHVT01077380.1.p1 GENE.GHVT01077380.1~~GHVT01077380.1.p1  ORF type:complete len:271 (-),score=31.42 GHVT01077380.1:44-856(-)